MAFFQTHVNVSIDNMLKGDKFGREVVEKIVRSFSTYFWGHFLRANDITFLNVDNDDNDMLKGDKFDSKVVEKMVGSFGTFLESFS